MNFLREFRQSLNLTLQEFADNIDVSKSYYEKIESGQRKPSREFMTKLKHKFPQFDVNIFFTEQKHKTCDKTKEVSWYGWNRKRVNRNYKRAVKRV